MRRTLLSMVVLCTAVVVPLAGASQNVSTSTVTGLTLAVNGKGEAMVTYRSQGKLVHVLAYGAVNARSPVKGGKQVALTLRYDGGYSKYYTDDADAKAAVAGLRGLQAQMAKATAAHNNPARYALAPKIQAAYALLAKLRRSATDYWKTFTCPAYKGPALAWQVAACRAPDGSSWAVQSWQRQLANYGEVSTPAQSAFEVHIAHWKGPLPVLDIKTNWAYKGKFDHLFGTFTYAGSGIYGFASTPTGAPLDTWGRNLYVDTFNSAYGAGWQRNNSFLTHKIGGSFCYGFYTHTFAGRTHPAGTGEKYRATIVGPGLTPDLMWQGSDPGVYDQAAQDAANVQILALNDPICRRV